MPLYDFRCPNCGAELEKRMSVSESEQPQVCAVCQHQPLEKLIGAPAVSYKGNWFATTGDY